MKWQLHSSNNFKRLCILNQFVKKSSNYKNGWNQMAKSKYSDQIRKIADFCKTFSKVGRYIRELEKYLCFFTLFECLLDEFYKLLPYT